MIRSVTDAALEEEPLVLVAADRVEADKRPSATRTADGIPEPIAGVPLSFIRSSG
jgi:hypothetical protein